jgi:NADPH-dependent glutamate synthase beta subunit-like oxidoreductase/2,4-dienoyl-CoA reductase-like NADH-dependent reductase (Old Yellow Enzyme family)
MDPSQRFRYRGLDELTAEIARRGYDLPADEDVSVLTTPVAFGRLEVPNRLAVQPMEGCDGTPDGEPGELTFRRYNRFAAGGAGLVWWEATAVVPEGRANPRQLWLHEGSVEAFGEMLRQARAAARESVGHEPVCVVQLTHSGRYSRPRGRPEPIIAHHSPVLDPTHDLPPDYPLISDEELDALQQSYVRAAELAAQAGFDAVDIKSCHRYLISELLASHTREGSRYGGSYENRTRFLRETAAKVRAAVGDRVEVTCRLNVYDAIEHPYGWGVAEGGREAPAGRGVGADLSEPLRLVGELEQLGFGGVNATAGNPYFNPHVNRPADWMIAQWPEPPEDPLTGVDRMVRLVRQVQESRSELTVVGSGYSWLRHYVPPFAAAAVRRGWVSIVGLGRGALAYPDFAKDILASGGMDRHKVCVACSSCTQMMRDGQVSGCVVRDGDVYAPIFRRGRRRSRDKLRELAAQCRRCVDPMCSTRCPAGVDIPGFLGALADGDEREAYEILRDRNPLPGICGAVCPVEVQCESACIQNLIGDGPVPIGEVQRNLSRLAVQRGWAKLDLPPATTGRRVAVVGAGPAGLTAAIELLRLGHTVAVLDAGGEPGGKVGGVIPPTRLSGDEAREEIEAIFASVPDDRIDWRYGEPLEPDRTLDDLLAEGFDAVVLAFGLGGLGRSEGEPGEGVMEANAFLSQMNRHPDHRCPRRVAVIGGGNTAVDAAVTARRRGATDAYLVYRRSVEQMPAWPDERRELLSAGVHLLLLCRPAGYVTADGGRLTGLRLVRTELGEADGSGRRRPVDLPDSEFVLPVEMVIEATGERGPSPDDDRVRKVLAGVELTPDGLVWVDEDTMATSREGVWAAGDAVNGGTTVVQAVAEGRCAARDIGVRLAARGK